MSEIWIFIIGVAVFALTIHGAVIAGSLAMQSVELAQNPRICDNEGETLPTDDD
ncbi:MAG: hypothetical protein R2707_19035 [Acidimicrobiales bacterium]